MKKVLITGARGFVGASIIEHIIENTSWDIYYTKRQPKPNDRLKRIDSMGRMFEWDGENIDIILHAAGNASSLACISDPYGAVNDNITETLNMLEIAKKYKVERFVYFSSVEVYGKDGVCLESDMCSAVNMYAATKYAGEQLCRAYDKSYGVPCSIVRLNNTFGKFCQEERFPMIAIKKLLNKEKFIIHTHKGGLIGRRWTSIYDVAEMVLFIIDQPPGGIYNTTSDYMTNIEFLKHIANAMNIHDFQFELIDEGVVGRMGNQDAPPNLIRSLGWKPSKTFEQRIKDFVNSAQASF